MQQWNLASLRVPPKLCRGHILGSRGRALPQSSLQHICSKANGDDPGSLQWQPVQCPMRTGTRKRIALALACILLKNITSIFGLAVTWVLCVRLSSCITGHSAVLHPASLCIVHASYQRRASLASHSRQVQVDCKLHSQSGVKVSQPSAFPMSGDRILHNTN